MQITIKLSDLSSEEKDVLILLIVFGKVIDNTLNHEALIGLATKKLVEKAENVKFRDYTADFWKLTQAGHWLAQGIPVTIDLDSE